MFGYKNPLHGSSIEFELGPTGHHGSGSRRHSASTGRRSSHPHPRSRNGGGNGTLCSPFDEINLNLVEDQQNPYGSSGVEELELQNFQIVNGGVYKKFVHVVATIDIVYSLLRLAIQFLELLTGGVGSSRHRNTYTYSLEHSKSNSNSLVQNATAVPADAIQPYAYTEINSSASRSLLVAIWSGKFIVCIVQLIVASALYSAATNLKDTRICIRNCRIWMWTSAVFVLLIVLELCGIAMIGAGASEGHVVLLSVLGAELIGRSIGELLVWRYVRQLKFQICDLDQDEHIVYYELCPSPAPTPGSRRRESREQNN